MPYPWLHNVVYIRTAGSAGKFTRLHPTIDLQTQNFWGWDQESAPLTSFTGDFFEHLSVGTTWMDKIQFNKGRLIQLFMPLNSIHH